MNFTLRKAIIKYFNFIPFCVCLRRNEIDQNEQCTIFISTGIFDAKHNKACDNYMKNLTSQWLFSFPNNFSSLFFAGGDSRETGFSLCNGPEQLSSTAMHVIGSLHLYRQYLQWISLCLSTPPRHPTFRQLVSNQAITITKFLVGKVFKLILLSIHQNAISDKCQNFVSQVNFFDFSLSLICKI